MNYPRRGFAPTPRRLSNHRLPLPVDVAGTTDELEFGRTVVRVTSYAPDSIDAAGTVGLSISDGLPRLGEATRFHLALTGSAADGLNLAAALVEQLGGRFDLLCRYCGATVDDCACDGDGPTTWDPAPWHDRQAALHNSAFAARLAERNPDSPWDEPTDVEIAELERLTAHYIPAPGEEPR